MFAQLNGLLRQLLREKEGRDAQPSAWVIDAQSVKTSTSVPASSQGIDAGKKTVGRKRSIVTDTLGLLPQCWSLPALPSGSAAGGTGQGGRRSVRRPSGRCRGRIRGGRRPGRSRVSRPGHGPCDGTCRGRSRGLRAHGAGPSAGMAAFAADRRDGLEQGDELGDAVAVPAGQGGGKRNAVASVIRWCLLPVVCRPAGSRPRVLCQREVLVRNRWG